MRLVFAFLPLCFLLCASIAPAHAQSGEAAYRGRTVQSVLDELRAAGLPLVYSSNLVPADLTVESEPAAADPLDKVREILAPYSLTVERTGGAWLVVRASSPVPADGAIAVTVTASDTGGPVSAGSVVLDEAAERRALVDGSTRFDRVSAGRHSVVVRARGYLPQRRTVDVSSGRVAAVAVALAVVVPKLDELTVTASRYDLAREVQPSSAFFSREQIERVSELGDDALRVAHRVPGVATNEFSSRSYVRGGAADEMAVVLDGMTLLEPYHLRDYQSVFSAIDQRIVSGMEIYSGGFPAAYGDALSGLTVIDEIQPTARRTELGMSLLFSSVLSAGTFRDGKADWLVSARRGNIDQFLDRRLGRPAYRDGFVHLGTALGSKHRLAFNGIGFDDDILVTPSAEGRDVEVGRSDTDNRQWWLTLDSRWSDALKSRTLLYSTSFAAERSGRVNDARTLIGSVEDLRKLAADGLKQDWQWNASTDQFLTFGFEHEDLAGRYAYTSTAEFFGVLAPLAPQSAAGTRDFSLAPNGTTSSAYVSDRVRLSARLVADIGLRWDAHSYLPSGDDAQLSPRASLLYRVSGSTDLRFSYGRFFQAEKLTDLSIQDGQLQFAPPQSATHLIVGVEHRLSDRVALRIEAFDKRTQHPRPRYENLFDPLVLLPELRAGRVLVAPQSADASGLELSVTGKEPVEWWLTYADSRVVDVIDGQNVPRSWDQRRALGAGVSVPFGPWSLSAAASWHSGWPATALTLETVSGPNGPQLVPVLGERNAERLGSVARLDARASRDFMTRRGSVRVFAEITNLTNRTNPCCVSYEVHPLQGGQAALDAETQRSLPLLANLGVLWQF